MRTSTILLTTLALAAVMGTAFVAADGVEKPVKDDGAEKAKWYACVAEHGEQICKEKWSAAKAKSDASGKGK